MARKYGYRAGEHLVKPKYSKRELLTSPVLYSTGNTPEVSVVVASYISDAKLRALKNLLERKGLVNYQILTPLRIKDVTDKDFKTGVTQLYLDNSFDLSKRIPKGSKVLSMGRSLYYLTRSSDLDIPTFYDHILHRTYFFDPIRQCRTYVIDDVRDVVGKDNFENYHAVKVIQQMVSDTYEIDTTPKYAVIIDTTEKLLQMFKDNIDKPAVAIDTETAGFDYLPTLVKKMSDKILSMELSFDGITGYHIVWRVILDNMRITQREIAKREQRYTNGKFDAKFLIFNGFRRGSIHLDHDIIQLRHTVNEMSKMSLKAQSFIHTNHGGYDFALDEYKKKYKVKSYKDIPHSLLGGYGADDATMTFRCVDENIKDIQEMDRLYPNPYNQYWNLERLYYEIRIPALNNYLDMELEGVPVDIHQLDETSNLVKQRIYAATQDLYLSLKIPKEMIDLSSLTYEETKEEEIVVSSKMKYGAKVLNDTSGKLNINSNQQLGRYIEDTLHWIIRERDSDGIPNVNKETVRRWIKDGHKEAQAIDTLSKLQTLFGTFIGERKGPKGTPSGFYQYLKNHGDNQWRIHTNFAVHLADSWRFKSRNPNLQNLPARGEKATLVRRHFTTFNKNEYFYSEDFSGLQLRLAAIVTMDPVMLEIFLRGDGDMHSQTAFEVFCRNIYYHEDLTKEVGYSLCSSTDPNAKKMTKPMFMKLKGSIKQLAAYRQKSKSINFGLLFSLAAHSLAMQFIKVEWEFSEIEAFIDENDLHSQLAKNLNYCGDVFVGMQVIYDKHKGIRRRRGSRFSVSEATDYFKTNNLFNDFEKQFGDEEVEKLYDAYAITVGEYIRESFFDTYKGLAKYGDDQRKKGRKQGFVRSIYGNFRRVPYLLYEGKDTNGAIWANKEAISINSGIQSMEAINVSRWLDNVRKECKSKKMKSRPFGTIHDASENMVVDKEVRQFYEINKKWSLHPYPELNGVPLETEAGVADYWGTKGTTKVDYEGNTVDAWELWDCGPEVTPSVLNSIEAKIVG